MFWHNVTLDYDYGGYVNMLAAGQNAHLTGLELYIIVLGFALVCYMNPANLISKPRFMS